MSMCKSCLNTCTGTFVHKLFHGVVKKIAKPAEQYYPTKWRISNACGPNYHDHGWDKYPDIKMFREGYVTVIWERDIAKYRLEMKVIQYPVKEPE